MDKLLSSLNLALFSSIQIIPKNFHSLGATSPAKFSHSTNKCNKILWILMETWTKIPTKTECIKVRTNITSITTLTTLITTKGWIKTKVVATNLPKMSTNNSKWVVAVWECNKVDTTSRTKEAKNINSMEIWVVTLEDTIKTKRTIISRIRTKTKNLISNVSYMAELEFFIISWAERDI